MKKFFKNIWAKLSGYKTYIGAGLHIAWFVANIVNKDLSTASEAAWIHSAIGTITTTGIGHKLSKTEKGKVITKKITDAAKRAVSK